MWTETIWKCRSCIPSYRAQRLCIDIVSPPYLETSQDRSRYAPKWRSALRTPQDDVFKSGHIPDVDDRSCGRHSLDHQTRRATISRNREKMSTQEFLTPDEAEHTWRLTMCAHQDLSWQCCHNGRKKPIGASSRVCVNCRGWRAFTKNHWRSSLSLGRS